MTNRTQRKALDIVFAVTVFVLLVIITGGSRAYAEGEPIDGGMYMNTTAPRLFMPITDIKTYGGSVADPIYFWFIPNRTEKYTIKTIGSIDTEGELYNSSGGSLQINDEGGINGNFAIEYQLFAGNVYYLRVVNYTFIPGDQTKLSITGNSGGFLEAPPLSAAAVTLAAPSAGATPITAAQIDSATSNPNYTVSDVVWLGTLTEGGKFAADSEYSATITLTSKNNRAFQTEAFTPSVTGASSVGTTTTLGTGTGNTVHFTAVFPKTEAKTITGISVKTQPTKLSYWDGESLDLGGIVATLTYNDLTTGEVPFAEYGPRGITTAPVNGTVMSVATHHDSPVTLSCNGRTAVTGNLTVTYEILGAAAVTITAPVTGGTPQTAAQIETATSNPSYTVSTVVWNEPMTGGKYQEDQIYTATITLISKNNKCFQATAFTPVVSGASSVGDTTTMGTEMGNSVSFTVTFPTTIDVTAPTVSNVGVPSNMNYKLGDNLDFTVHFSERVIVSNSPRLAVVIGSDTFYAYYMSGSDSSSLVFRYTVMSGAQDSNGIAIGAMELNGGTIKDGAGNDAELALNNVTSTEYVLVDGVVPAVSSVRVPDTRRYKAGDAMDFSVTFSEPVDVTGIPYIPITLTTGGERYAYFITKSGASVLTFRYQVTGDVADNDGIGLGGAINVGAEISIKDTAGNNAVLSLNHVAPTTGILVDGILPYVNTVAVPASGRYKEGDILEFTVNYNEEIIVTGTTSGLQLNVGGTTRNASYLSSSGSNITYRYTVQAGDDGGITISTDSLILNTAIIKDAAGNIASVALNSVGSTAGIILDTIAPGAVTDIVLSDLDANPGIDGRDFTVAFTDLKDESDVTAYKIYLYKDGEVPADAAVMKALAAGSRVAVKTIAKTAGNDGATNNLGSSVTTDSKGQTLNGGDYLAIVCAVDSVGNYSFQVTGTSVLIVKEVDNNPPGDSGVSVPVKTEGKLEKDQMSDDGIPVASLNDSSEDLKSKVLSAEEQALVATGKNAKVILKVEDISAAVSEKDRRQIEEKLAAEQLNVADTALLYFDISLFKKIGDGEETRVTETRGRINISIEVPDSMWNTKDGIDRTYRVIRVHNGVAELLEGTYDPDTHLFTFETDRFSTYALMYKDVSISANQSDGSAKDKITVYQDFNHLRLSAKAAKTSQKLTYAKISGADGYLIYGAKCGQELKKLADVKGTVTSNTVKNLKQSTYYKYQVKAYKIIDGEKVIIATSKLIRSVTTSKIYGNPTEITSNITSVTLAVGKTKKMIYQVVLPENKRMKDYASLTRFESTDKKIATISSSGKITAISKGTCYVYVYAQNGVYQKIKVTVE